MTTDPGSLPVPLDALAAIGPVGVAVIDADLRYRYVDETLAAMNGLPAAEHTGRRIRDVLPEAAADLLEPLVRDALAGRPTHDVRVQAPPPDTRRFSLSGVPVAGPDGPVCVGLVVEDHREEAAFALRVTEERLRLALEGTEVGFWEWDVRSDAIRWSENHGPLFGLPRGAQPADYEEFLGFLHPADRDRVQGIVGGALDGDGWADEQWRIVRTDGVVRWVESRGHLLRDEDGAPLALVGITTDVTARRRREQRAAFLADATAMLARTLDPEETLAEIARLAVTELAEWCIVHLLDEHGRLQLATTAHTDPDRAAAVVQLAERYPPEPDAPRGVAAVLRTGRSELYPEISDELLAATARDDDHLALLRELQLRAAMVVPLTARGQTLGTLSFLAGPAQSTYDEQDLDTAEALGRRAGLALDNARLHAAQQAAIRRLEAVQAVTDVGLAHLDLDDLLRELLGRVREVTGSDSAAILLPEDDGGGLRVVTSVGEGTRPGADVLEVPLQHDAGTIGVLRVRCGHDGGFEDADRTLLDLVAQRAATAIAHSRLYERARDVAVTLQRSLLPAPPAPVAGMDLAVRYLPGQEGAEVGGDWYDVVALPDDRVVLVVGDVEGRGTAAAALMGRLRAVLRAYVFDGQGPADALTRLDLLVGEDPGAEYATAVLASVAPDRSSMTVCCAGHPPPLLLVPGQAARLVPVRPGVPIGAPAPPRLETEVPLGAGARVLLYTDGLVERRATPLQERLAALVAAAETAPPGAEALLDQVTERLGDAAQADDVALLAAQVADRPPSAVLR